MFLWLAFDVEDDGMNLSLLAPPFESLFSVASTDTDTFTGTRSREPDESKASETGPGSIDPGEGEDMTLPTSPSNFLICDRWLRILCICGAQLRTVRFECNRENLYFEL